jgi:hypothetical protein
MPNIIDLIDEVDDRPEQKESGSQQPGQQGTFDARLVKIDVSFFDLMSFLVKLSIAAVPAAIIVFFFWTLVGVLFGFGVGALVRPFMRF